MFYFNIVFISVFALFTLWFAISSFRERVFRAGILGLTLAVLLASCLLLYGRAYGSGLLSGAVMLAAQIIAGALMFFLTLSMFLPIGRRGDALAGTKGMKMGEGERFDQKDTAFNIAHVGGYGPDVGKKRWALQSRDPFGGIYWTLCMGLRGQADGKVNPARRTGFKPEEITREIKGIARYAGADLVGITAVKQDFAYRRQYHKVHPVFEGLPMEQTAIFRAQSEFLGCGPIPRRSKGAVLDYRDILWKKDQVETGPASGSC